MRGAALFALLFAVAVTASCRGRCERSLDCGATSYCSAEGRCEVDCFTDQDCRVPPECRANPANCPSKGLYCSARGKCVGAPVKERDDVEVEVPTVGPPDGWSDPPGAGVMFVVDRLQISQSRVFDVDGNGRADNVLAPLAGEVNGEIQQGVQGGAAIILLEIAGLDEPYTGTDESVTLKVYSGRDADDYAANNLRPAFGGDGRCCEFLIDVRSTPLRNIVPAEIEDYRLVTDPNRDLALSFLLTVGLAPYRTVDIERARVEVELDSDLRSLRSGALGGAVTARSLLEISNPYDGPHSALRGPTLLDVATTIFGPSPDIDLDLDGLECALDTTGDEQIDTCCDGVVGAGVCSPVESGCGERPVIVSPSAEASRCPVGDGFHDGYSVGLTFSAVAVRVVGLSN